MGNNCSGDENGTIPSFDEFQNHRSEEFLLFREELNRFPNLMCPVVVLSSDDENEEKKKKNVGNGGMNGNVGHGHHHHVKNSEMDERNVKKGGKPNGERDLYEGEGGANLHHNLLKIEEKKINVRRKDENIMLCCCRLNLVSKMFKFYVSDCCRKVWKKEVKVKQMYNIKSKLDIGKKLKWRTFFNEFAKAFKNRKITVCFKDPTKVRLMKSSSYRSKICYLNIEVSKIPFIKQSEISLRLAPSEMKDSYVEIGVNFTAPMYEFYEYLKVDDPIRKIKELEKELVNCRKKYGRLVKEKSRSGRRSGGNGRKGKRRGKGNRNGRKNSRSSSRGEEIKEGIEKQREKGKPNGGSKLISSTIKSSTSSGSGNRMGQFYYETRKERSKYGIDPNLKDQIEYHQMKKRSKQNARFELPPTPPPENFEKNVFDPKMIPTKGKIITVVNEEELKRKKEDRKKNFKQIKAKRSNEHSNIYSSLNRDDFHKFSLGFQNDEDEEKLETMSNGSSNHSSISSDYVDNYTKKRKLIKKHSEANLVLPPKNSNIVYDEYSPMYSRGYSLDANHHSETTSKNILPVEKRKQLFKSPRLSTQNLHGSFSERLNDVMGAWGVIKSYDKKGKSGDMDSKTSYVVKVGGKVDIYDKNRMNDGVKQIDELMKKLIASKKITDSEYNSFHAVLVPLKKLLRINHLYPHINKKNNVYLDVKEKEIIKEKIKEKFSHSPSEVDTKKEENSEEKSDGEDNVENKTPSSGRAIKKKWNIQVINNLKEISEEDLEEVKPQIEGGLSVNHWAKEERIKSELEKIERIISFEKERDEKNEDTSKTSDTENASKISLNAIPQEKTRELILKMFERVDEWNFDVFILNVLTEGETLFMTGYALFIKYDFIRIFNVPDNVLVSFLREIDDGYRSNPYHNAMHAADVAQISHYIITHTHLGKKMTALEKMGLIVASLIHDFDHPGLNNKFNVETSSYLAVLYNDRSVLENHHVAQAFELMKSQEYNIFQNLKDDQYDVIRTWIINMVLSTDMDEHQNFVRTFKSHLFDVVNSKKKKAGSIKGSLREIVVKKDDKALPPLTRSERIKKYEELLGVYEKRLISSQMMIKFADVSNCTRPIKLYLKWALRIETEFYNQGDKERELDIKISPFMNRNKPELHKLQKTFMGFIIRPMLEELIEVFPKLEFAMKYLNKNKRYWDKFCTVNKVNIEKFEKMEEERERGDMEVNEKIKKIRTKKLDRKRKEKNVINEDEVEEEGEN